MSFAWLITLTVYGFAQGWSNIPVLMWLLLVPFVVQDMQDRRSS